MNLTGLIIRENNMKKPKKLVKIEETESTPFAPMNPERSKVTARILIGTPTCGIVRMEWVNARFGATIPCNWSHIDVLQSISPYVPIGYSVADAENLTAKVVVEGGFEWFLSIEDDNVIPRDAFIRINKYMVKGDVPVVSGLYFTKSVPPEPIMYRGFGTGYYADWKMGDKVWVTGVPFGFTLIHSSLIKAAWAESPEYIVNGVVTRKVFNYSRDAYVDPLTGAHVNEMGTTDLAWCKRLVRDRIFEKAGWPEYQKKENPFLVDTSIFVKHIDRNDGTLYPRALPGDFLTGKITFKDALDQLY
jgi:hypothetical protein